MGYFIPGRDGMGVVGGWKILPPPPWGEGAKVEKSVCVCVFLD